MIKSSLCSPADIKVRFHVCFGPVKDLGQLLPVIDVFEWYLFDRSAGNDQAVKLSVFDLIEGDIML